jgi:DNA repair ATPase RecN
VYLYDWFITLFLVIMSLPGLSLPDEQLCQLANEAIEKTAQHLQGELLVTSNDFQLLESMNRQTQQEYQSIKENVTTMNRLGPPIRATYQSLEPYLVQIDPILKQVNELASIARELDAYTKELEIKVQRYLNNTQE